MRFRLRSLLIFIAATAIVFAGAALIGRLTEYPRHQRRGANLIETLDHRRPPSVSQQTWDDATGWAITAYWNICFSEGLVPLGELDSFIADTEEKLDGNVDLSTIDWIWARLAATGPHGKEYAAKFEPQYRLTVYRSRTTSGAP